MTNEKLEGEMEQRSVAKESKTLADPALPSVGSLKPSEKKKIFFVAADSVMSFILGFLLGGAAGAAAVGIMWALIALLL